MTPKERHLKHRASVKKHFAEKRAAKAKAAAPKPAHKPSPASTAGKTMSYYSGKATVVDLGHKPSKSAISGAAAKLRKAKAATKPKATSAPPSAAKAPEIKLTTAPKPTTSNPATKKSATGDVWAGLAIAAGVTGLGAGAVKLTMKKPAATPAPTVKVKQLTLPAPNKGLPKPLLGLPGGKQADRVAQVKEIQRKGKILFDLEQKSAPGARRHAAATPSPGTKAQAAPELKAASAASRGKQGTSLRHVFEAVKRADARAAAAKPAKPVSLTPVKTPGAAIVEAESRAKGNAPKVLTQEASMAEPVQDARARAAIAKATKGFTDPATAVQKSERRSSERRGAAPKIDTARGFGASEAEISKVAKSGAAVKAPTQAQAAANKKALSDAPKDVQKMAAEIDTLKKSNAKLRGAKIETVTTTPTTGAPKPVDLSSGGQAPITKIAKPGVVHVPKAAVVKGKPSKVAAVRDGGEPKANKATSLMSGEARQAANQAARAAIRSGDPVAAKKALAGLPETGRKAGRYRATLKAGAIGGGSGSAPKSAGYATGAPKAPAAPKAVSLTGAQRQSANQAARAAMRSGDAVAMRKALTALPETGKKAIKYRKNLEAGIESAGNKPAAAPKTPARPKQTRKQSFRDRKNQIDPKTGRPTNKNLMETTIEPERITPERDAAETRERATKLGAEARTELEIRGIREKAEKQPSSERKGRAPTPTGPEPANRGATAAVSKAAVKSPEAPRVTENEAAHQKLQRFNAEGRQTENVNVKALSEQVVEGAKLGKADNMRQKMARAAATAVLKQSGEATSAAKPKAISLTSQSTTPAPKVSKTEAYRNYEALKQTGVKSPTAGKVKPKAKGVAKTPKADRKPLKPRGEQIPRVSPKTTVIPPVSDMKAEQARSTAKPTKATKSYPAMSKPSKFTFADSIRKYAQKIAKPLTGSAIGAHVGENITKPKSKVGAAIKAGAVLTGLFAFGEAGVARAEESDPSKKTGAAKAAFKKGAVETAKGVAGYTAAAAVTGAVLGKAVSRAIFSTALPAVLTYKTGKDYTIPKLQELGKAVEGAATSRREAKAEKKASQAKYGTIERATKTRHAKEAIKKKQRDLLTGGK